MAIAASIKRPMKVLEDRDLLQPFESSMCLIRKKKRDGAGCMLLIRKERIKGMHKHSREEGNLCKLLIAIK